MLQTNRKMMNSRGSKYGKNGYSDLLNDEQAHEIQGAQAAGVTSVMEPVPIQLPRWLPFGAQPAIVLHRQHAGEYGHLSFRPSSAARFSGTIVLKAEVRPAPQVVPS